MGKTLSDTDPVASGVHWKRQFAGLSFLFMLFSVFSYTIVTDV